MNRLYISPSKTVLTSIDTLCAFYGISRASVGNILLTEAIKFHLDRVEKSLDRQQRRISGSVV